MACGLRSRLQAICFWGVRMPVRKISARRQSQQRFSERRSPMTSLVEHSPGTQIPALDAVVSSEQAAVPPPSTTPVAVKERIYRHKLPVRLGHWLNVVCLFILIMSGLQIFNAHP